MERQPQTADTPPADSTIKLMLDPPPANSASLLIGQNVSHYNIIKELGRGAMGEVYLAQDTKLPRKVALKFLAPTLANLPDFKARFKREAEAAASIQHPNVITVHEVGDFENRPYFVMEYVDGESLTGLIAQKELSIHDALEIMMQICAGIKKAHQRDILHRDLKPSNILISHEGLVKVADFGLAKLREGSQITIAGTMMGTVPYMSPEQFRGEELDQRSDIFSLGVILYELLTQQLPFKGKTLEAISLAILNQRPELLQRHKPEVSDHLQHIVDQALAKDLGKRYQNVDAFLADLNKEKKRLSETPTPIPPQPRPRPRALVLALLGIGALLLVGLVSYLQFDKPQREKPVVAAPLAMPIFIASNPNGASVFLNEDSIGVTPLNFSSSNSGMIKIRLQKPDYFSLDTAFVIRQGQDSTFSLALQPAARVSIKVNPVEAKVVLDGKAFLPSQLKDIPLRVGEHNINVSAEGYIALAERFSLFQGRNPALNYRLTKNKNPTPPQSNSGSISFSSDPPGADIFVDGTPVGVTPMTSQKEEGEYQIVLRKEGYEEYSTSVQLNRGQTQSVNAMLTALVGTLNVLVSPVGSLIYINEKFYQENMNRPFKTELTVGAYLLKMVHPQFGIWEKMIKIAAEESLNVNIDFNKSVKLTITSIPEPGGEIIVDGISKGYTPKQLTLRVGKRRIELRREGYNGETKTINLEDDLKEPLQLMLAKNP